MPNNYPHYVRLVLLSNHFTLVVMVLHDALWHLPYFEYPTSITKGARIHRLSSDFRPCLGISSSKPTVTPSVDLLAHLLLRSKPDKAQLGRGNLMLINLHFHRSVNDIQLPAAAQ